LQASFKHPKLTPPARFCCSSGHPVRHDTLAAAVADEINAPLDEPNDMLTSKARIRYVKQSTDELRPINTGTPSALARGRRWDPPQTATLPDLEEPTTPSSASHSPLGTPVVQKSME
jgi:hypothetical protein